MFRETAKIEALEIKYRKMMEDNNLEKVRVASSFKPLLYYLCWAYLVISHSNHFEHVSCLFFKALLEQQLAVEKGKMETEKKKFQHAMEEKVSL